MRNDEIVCLGEILWDSLPAGLFLGGAPFNVAHDLHRLGNRVRVVSRIGRDFLGEEVLRRLRRVGISTELIQLDDKLPTGFIEVVIDEEGNPIYRIKEPVAWDSIEVEDELLQTVKNAGMIVFGTLACRNKTSRETIHTLTKIADMKVYDVNLRPGASSKEIVEDLLNAADIVKVNSLELDALRKWFGLPSDERDAVGKLAEKFSCNMVCVSRGANGGSMWHNGRWVHHPGFRVSIENSVGAGDAFVAGLLTSFVQGKSDEEMIETANLLGAYVVTQTGATPEFTLRDLDMFSIGVHSRGDC